MEPVLLSWDEDQTIIKAKITNRASIRILERYPLKENKVNTLFEAEEVAGGDPEELYKLCRQLLNSWKFLIYFLPKPDTVIDIFREKNYPDIVIKGILEAYTSDVFSSLVESLASCSNSGIPHVISTDWTSRTVSNRNSIASSDREAFLTLTTDQGIHQVQLNGTELEKLYWTVNEVQKSLDRLLEG